MQTEGDLFPIDPTEHLPPGLLRTMQIIATAMLLGIVSFLGIVLYIVLARGGAGGPAPPRDGPILTLIALVVLAIDGVLAFVLPRVQTRTALQRILAGTWPVPASAAPTTYATTGAKLLAVRQTTLIVSLALLEGAAFLGCIAYLIEANPVALGVVGGAVVLMLCLFPTEARVRAWLERQVEALNELRQQQV